VNLVVFQRVSKNSDQHKPSRTVVVIDASAGVELAADTLHGRALRALLPADAVPWVPELFFVECGAVLRRWDLNRILTPAQIDQAIDALMGWPLRLSSPTRRPTARRVWHEL
jgi:predicted nucleic acid-binding protein